MFYLVPSIPLPQSFLLTLFLNKVHHLVNSKGNVQVLFCLWSTMTRECVSVKHEHFLSVLGGLISLFSSLRMRMDTVVCVGSTRLLMPQWVEGPRHGGYVEEFVSQHVLQCYRFTMKIKPICNLKMKKKLPKNTVSKSTSLPNFYFYVHIFYKPCSIPKMCECMSKISVKEHVPQKTIGISLVSDLGQGWHAWYKHCNGHQLALGFTVYW